MSGHRELERLLSQALHPVYVIAGEDTLQVQEARDALRQKARQADHSEYTLLIAEKAFDWSRFDAETANRSLFGDRKVIDLRLDIESWPAAARDTARQHIKAYCDRPDLDTVLIISAGRLSKKEQQTSWYQQAASVGGTLTLWPPRPNEFPGWLRQRCTDAGLKISPEALALLVERTEGNLLAAHQEITKLRLLLEKDSAGMEDILAAVGDSARYDVFKLVDRILEGKPRDAWRTLQGLRGEGIEPLSILWALTREIRTLLALGQRARHEGRDSAMGSLHVMPMRRSLVSASLDRIPRKLLWQALAKMADIDRSVKGLARHDPWLVLETVTVELASASR
ncbi:MAG: DNA polymerase III subunit delta [Gammaproteobacteria bacterium]|nr:MAG: DNA polymerase III subunit delta [Gammaproteobacteria bacterium]